MSAPGEGGRAPFSAAELEGGAAHHVHPHRVRFQEIDAAGIVFFARIFEYFHDAYVGFLHARGVDHALVFKERRWGAPLAHAEADYRAPLFFGDDLEIDVAALRLGNASMRVGYRLRGPRGVHALGQTVHVFVSLDGLSPIAVPAEVRAAVGDAAAPLVPSRGLLPR